MSRSDEHQRTNTTNKRETFVGSEGEFDT